MWSFWSSPLTGTTKCFCVILCVQQLVAGLFPIHSCAVLEGWSARAKPPRTEDVAPFSARCPTLLLPLAPFLPSFLSVFFRHFLRLSGMTQSWVVTVEIRPSSLLRAPRRCCAAATPAPSLSSLRDATQFILPLQCPAPLCAPSH